MLVAASSAAPHIDCITGVFKDKAFIPTVFHVDDELATAQSIIIALTMADSFAISKVYDDYDAYISVKLSFIAYEKSTKATPGIIVSPDGVSLVFIPAAREGDSPRLWTVGVSTTLLNVHKFGTANDVSFTPAVMSTIPLTTALNYSLKMLPSVISFTRKTSVLTLGTWVYNRTSYSGSVLSKINSVLPTYMPSDSGHDMLHVWDKFCSRYSSWINGMIQLVEGDDPVTRPALISLSLMLTKSMPAPVSYSHFRNDVDAIVVVDHNMASTRIFLAQAIRTVTSWMYYSGNSVFATVVPEDVPVLASRILSVMNGLCKVLVFRIPNNSTVDAAYVTLPALLDKRAPIVVTTDCKERYRRNAALSKRIVMAKNTRIGLLKSDLTMSLLQNR